MSLFLLMEELHFISGKMVCPKETGSHHGWYMHMLRCIGPSQNLTGDHRRGTSKEDGLLSETFVENQGVLFCFSHQICPDHLLIKMLFLGWGKELGLER